MWSPKSAWKSLIDLSVRHSTNLSVYLHNSIGTTRINRLQDKITTVTRDGMTCKEWPTIPTAYTVAHWRRGIKPVDDGGGDDYRTLLHHNGGWSSSGWTEGDLTRLPFSDYWGGRRDVQRGNSCTRTTATERSSSSISHDHGHFFPFVYKSVTKRISLIMCPQS